MYSYRNPFLFWKAATDGYRLMLSCYLSCSRKKKWGAFVLSGLDWLGYGNYAWFPGPSLKFLALIGAAAPEVRRATA